jgi:hypothetical protein
MKAGDASLGPAPSDEHQDTTRCIQLVLFARPSSPSVAPRLDMDTLYVVIYTDVSSFEP